MPQLRRVCTPLGEISYTLTRKKVKNLNLRITGGEVRLSAGPRVPLARCDQMVAERAGWIQSSLARQQSRESRFFLPNCPAEGDVILFLGEPVALHLWDGAAALPGDSLFLPSENPRKALDDFLAAQCRAGILPLCREVEALSPAFLAPTPPVVSFRRMTSRWGSCSPQKRRITLSTRLIHLPLLAIQGVVIHEYAHLAVPNHSARFYDLVRQLMPTYPAAAALLKGG